MWNFSPCLWHAIYDKYGSVNAMGKAHPEIKNRFQDIGKLLLFKRSPFKQRYDSQRKLYFLSTEYRSICLALEKILRLPVEDLFPAHLYQELVGMETEKAIEVCSLEALPGTVRREILALPAPAEESPEVLASQHELRSRLLKVFKTLSYREREIVKLRYGIPDGNPHTLEEVGEIFKLNRERVRQIEAKAVQKLQQPYRSEQLVSFLD